MEPNRPTSDPTRSQVASARPKRRRLVLAGALATALLALGAVAAARGPFGFGPLGPHDPALAREHAEFVVERTLARVEATPEQVEKVQAIVGETLDDLSALREDHRGLRAEIVAVLTADEIDREKLENLRVEQLAGFDAASKRILTAFADAGDVLTPRQRAAVAEQMAERRARHLRHWQD